jgi:hypothetical protein
MQLSSHRHLWLWVLAIIALAQSSSVADTLVIQTKSGAVRGVNIGSVNQWRGIPYAAPPVGNLR